jgi:hypothetical protein
MCHVIHAGSRSDSTGGTVGLSTDLKEFIEPVDQFQDCATPSTAPFRYGLAVLDGIVPSEYGEPHEPSLDIASLSSSDLPKQITIIRETRHPNGKPTSFGMIARVLEMTKVTVADHYARCLAERCDGLRSSGNHADSREPSKWQKTFWAETKRSRDGCQC